MVRVLLVLLLFALAVYALTDCANADDEERAGLPRGVWIVLIILVPLAGSIAWFVVSRNQRAKRGAQGSPAAGYRPSPAGLFGSRPTTPPPVTAPDDDPEFLWLLEQARRKREREAQQGGAAAPGSAGDEGPAASPEPDDDPGRHGSSEDRGSRRTGEDGPAAS